ncbi:MAG: LamB/YcsF family protein [Firmicutes bacterium]|nr:LamB/YcsF family protein [Bacillota bacterium]
MKVVDLNCDLGEDFGRWKISLNPEIMSLITSANIACGFHAGSPGVMRRTVKLAARGMAIGAHPGLPDLVGFGRRPMDISPDEARDDLVYQVGALAAFARAEGVRLTHVKPHGALYNQAAGDRRLAEALVEGIREVDPSLILVALSGSELYKAGKTAGLRTASEVFGDRTYSRDGGLVPRSQPGALIHDHEKAVEQVLRMVQEGVVIAVDGTRVPIVADTICLHGDGPDALGFAQAIRTALERSGVRVAPLADWLEM